MPHSGVVRPRRKLAVALVVSAVAVIALSVVSAADAGYHFDPGDLMLPEQHQGYVYLHILGDPPESGARSGRHRLARVAPSALSNAAGRLSCAGLAGHSSNCKSARTPSSRTGRVSSNLPSTVSAA